MKSLYDNQHEAEMIERLKSLEITPPKGSWDDIQNSLKLKRKRSIVIFSSLASAASVALFFTIAGINFISRSHNSSSQDVIAISQDKSEKTENTTVQPKVIGTENAIVTTERKVKTISVVEDVTYQTVEASDECLRQTDVPEAIQPIQIKPLRIYAQSQSVISFKSKLNQNYTNLALSSKQENKHKGEWFISASGFPEYSFHTAGVLKKEGAKNESGMMSWGGSVFVRYKFSKSFSIESGLTYSTMGEKGKNLYLASSYFRRPSNLSSSVSSSYGTITISNSTYSLMDEGDVNSITPLVAIDYTKVKATQMFRYIELPVLLVKQLYYRGISFDIKAGVSESILIGNRFVLNGDKVSLSGKTKGVDVYSTSAIAALNFSIPFGKNVNLLIEPNIKLGLKPLSTSYGKSYPFASYIKFGVEVPL